MVNSRAIWRWRRTSRRALREIVVFSGSWKREGSGRRKYAATKLANERADARKEGTA
jgi:hypothetical protein